jgi:hypothetical protein
VRSLRLLSLSASGLLLLAGCKSGPLPPESRCSMYWDYYYNAGLGQPLAERQKAEGVDFADIRVIVATDPSDKTRVCQRVLNDAFPTDPALSKVTAPIPQAAP